MRVAKKSSGAARLSVAFLLSLARLDAVADHLALLRGAVRHARAQQVAGQVQATWGVARRRLLRRRRFSVPGFDGGDKALQRGEVRVHHAEQRGEAVGPLRGAVVVGAQDAEPRALLQHGGDQRRQRGARARSRRQRRRRGGSARNHRVGECLDGGRRGVVRQRRQRRRRLARERGGALKPTRSGFTQGI